MKISMLFNRASQLEVEHKYTSCKPLAHINELCKTNPGVVNPNSTEFNGEVLASTVYIEAKKLQDPINFLLVINEVLKNATSSLSNDFSQDNLMDIKHDISKNIVCKLHRDEREHMSELLSSERLHVIAAKLVYVQDCYSGSGDVRGFRALEIFSMVNFLHKYLHGDDIKEADPVQPASLDWEVLDEVLSNN
ncbi:hypothetical protein H0A36_28020 [Endozoicomonas sp. SM1973]|uniref:Uncharacterized protein n=1 Tax=Spartinivicinus marinus TaxID=2994442 RepID=A0A853IIK5_9GAMM|nr:hypothetical protein [Spartinivicinus marinus]MCX4030409.1 hypothetical protein [Spartinivicinus marinus]NYZ69864.1 hypothetical protein [Spartinivicinus marinus]